MDRPKRCCRRKMQLPTVSRIWHRKNIKATRSRIQTFRISQEPTITISTIYIIRTLQRQRIAKYRIMLARHHIHRPRIRRLLNHQRRRRDFPCSDGATISVIERFNSGVVVARREEKVVEPDAVGEIQVPEREAQETDWFHDGGREQDGVEGGAGDGEEKGARVGGQDQSVDVGGVFDDEVVGEEGAVAVACVDDF